MVISIFRKRFSKFLAIRRGQTDRKTRMDIAKLPYLPCLLVKYGTLIFRNQTPTDSSIALYFDFNLFSGGVISNPITFGSSFLCVPL